ncbi:hypothetical protein E4U51_000792 [Claviceps purpurea]|nr:hypothetical protein E4U51_000792 [Claviceps purpurea]
MTSAAGSVTMFIPILLYGARCIATQQPIPGDDWQTNCILIGVRQGYFAFDNKGNPITNVPAMKVETAVGNCD